MPRVTQGKNPVQLSSESQGCGFSRPSTAEMAGRGRRPLLVAKPTSASLAWLSRRTVSCWRRASRPLWPRALTSRAAAPKLVMASSSSSAAPRWLWLLGGAGFFNGAIGRIKTLAGLDQQAHARWQRQRQRVVLQRRLIVAGLRLLIEPVGGFAVAAADDAVEHQRFGRGSRRGGRDGRQRRARR